MINFLVRCEVAVKMCSFYLFIFSYRGIQMTENHFLKYTFPPLQCNVTFVTNQVIVYLWVYFYTLYSVLLDYLSILEPISHHFNSCSFIISLAIWESKPFRLILFLHDCFVLFWLSVFLSLYLESLYQFPQK